MADSKVVAEARVALGRQLAASRLAAGLSQQQLAPLSGHSRSTVANAETGRQRESAGRELRERPGKSSVADPVTWPGAGGDQRRRGRDRLLRVGPWPVSGGNGAVVVDGGGSRWAEIRLAFAAALAASDRKKLATVSKSPLSWPGRFGRQRAVVRLGRRQQLHQPLLCPAGMTRDRPGDRPDAAGHPRGVGAQIPGQVHRPPDAAAGSGPGLAVAEVLLARSKACKQAAWRNRRSAS